MQKETSVWKFIFSSFFLFYISDNILEVFMFDPRQNETTESNIGMRWRYRSRVAPELVSGFMINLFVSLREARQETFRCLLIEKCLTRRRTSKKFNNFYLNCHRNVRIDETLFCLPFREFFLFCSRKTPKMPLHQPRLYVYLLTAGRRPFNVLGSQTRFGRFIMRFYMSINNVMSSKWLTFRSCFLRNQ